MLSLDLVARAPGKAMLIGEYAVLDGAPAVVAAVDRFAVARLCPGAEPGSPFIEAALRAARALLAELGRELAGALPTPVVDTESFSLNGQKLGVGSSASATVAAVGALLAAAGLDLDDAAVRARVLASAVAAHDAAQGVRGSGADVVAATWGGVCTLNHPGPGTQWQADFRPQQRPLPVEVRFVATPTSVSTAGLVQRCREVGAAAHPALLHMTDAAQRFIAAWTAGSAAALLAAVSQAYEAYEQLGQAMERALVTPEHAAIAAAARRAGGVAKPSGAGGGDLAVVFLPDAEAATALARTLPDGLPMLPMAISSRGLHAAPAAAIF